MSKHNVSEFACFTLGYTLMHLRIGKLRGYFVKHCASYLYSYFTIVKFSTVVIFWIHKCGFSDAFLNDNILNYEARFINICRVLP